MPSWLLVGDNEIEFAEAPLSDVEYVLPRGCRITGWERRDPTTDNIRATVNTGRFRPSSEPVYGIGGYEGQVRGADEPMTLREVLTEEALNQATQRATEAVTRALVGMPIGGIRPTETDDELRERIVNTLNASVGGWSWDPDDSDDRPLASGEVLDAIAAQHGLQRREAAIPTVNVNITLPASIHRTEIKAEFKASFKNEPDPPTRFERLDNIHIDEEAA